MNAKYLLRICSLFLLTILAGNSLMAQDRLFTYTYQSTVLSQGQRELESWNTMRLGREDYYSRFDNRTEYEIGLGHNLQTAFYLNLTSSTKTVEGENGKSLTTNREIGFSNEWKLKLLDPVAHTVGMALYGEVGISSDETELEGKVILDKKIGNLVISLNGVYEHELSPEYSDNKLIWQKENKAEAYLAFAYAVTPRFHITNENAFKNIISDGKTVHSALFSGIGISYVRNNFWINCTAMPQIVSFKKQTEQNLDLDEYEKAQFRILFSFIL